MQTTFCGDTLHEAQNLVLWRNKKNVTDLSMVN